MSDYIIPVLITTSHRYVYFGWADLDDVAEIADGKRTSIRLEDARMAIFWGTKGGEAELARVGPNSSSRIGDPVKSVTVIGIAACHECTNAAVTKWAKADVRGGKQ